MATADVFARLKSFDEQYIPFPPFVAAMSAFGKRAAIPS